MSTYQYYEFLAVDRALTSAEQGALRELSTRADITSSRFVNVYNYGSFKGDPDRLMERYFDVFVYVDSWGTRELQFRLPRRLFEPALAQPYLHEESLSLRTKGDHVLLKFRVDREEEAPGRGRGARGRALAASGEAGGTGAGPRARGARGP